jgi:hypothetical protein
VSAVVIALKLGPKTSQGKELRNASEITPNASKSQCEAALIGPRSKVQSVASHTLTNEEIEKRIAAYLHHQHRSKTREQKRKASGNGAGITQTAIDTDRSTSVVRRFVHAAGHIRWAWWSCRHTNDNVQEGRAHRKGKIKALRRTLQCSRRP